MISRYCGIFSVGLLLTVGVDSVLLASVTALLCLLALLSAKGREKTDGQTRMTNGQRRQIQPQC